MWIYHVISNIKVKDTLRFFFSFLFFLFFFLTTLETKLNNGRPRWSILSCSRNFRVIPEALPLLCQLVFSNHDAAEHLVFCVQCSCHRSVIEKWNQVHSSRPVNAMQSLLYWPFSECYIVALTFLFIRLRHLLNSQVCQVYSEIETMPWASCTLITYIGTILNLTIISIDRYLAVRSVCQYRFWVTPASRPLRLYSSMSGFHCSCDW